MSEASSGNKKMTVGQSDLKRVLDSLPGKDDSMNEDLVAIITSVAHIDDLLKDILSRILIPTGEDQDSLIDESGTMNSFRLRAKLAFRLGLITSEFYAGLKELSVIRNKCAHSSDKFSPFRNSSIIQRVRNLYERLHAEFREDDAEYKSRSGLTVTPGEQLRIAQKQFLVVASCYRATLRLILDKQKPLLPARKEIIFRNSD